MEGTLQNLAKEAAVIAAAPWSFLIACGVIAGAIYWVVKLIKSSEVEALKAQISTQKERIDFFKEKFIESEKAETRLKKELEQLQTKVAELQSKPSDPQVRAAIATASSNAASALQDLSSTSATIRGAMYDSTYFAALNRGSIPSSHRTVILPGHNDRGQRSANPLAPQYLSKTKRDP